MLKINYPANSKDLHKKYTDCFSGSTMHGSLKKFLARKNLATFSKWSLDNILVSPLPKLFKFSAALNKKMSSTQRDDLKAILNYDSPNKGHTTKQQPKIARFFMENSDSFGLSTCYFCNIDFINAFNDIDDYQNSYDFFQRATKEELMAIKDINKTAAEKIIKERKLVKTIKALTITAAQKESLEKLVVSEKKSHFTLDHVLDKATHPIAALSLYNFVPSCYNCNSKLKGSIPLVNTISQEFLSPTSSTFTFAEAVRFKLFFPLDSTKTFKDVKTTNDFTIDFEIDSNEDEYRKYIATFKLKARYAFHKRVALSLIEKTKRYDHTQIKEISYITKVPISQIRKDIFGEELFQNVLEVQPLTKLRRDVAKDIGIKGVI